MLDPNPLGVVNVYPANVEFESLYGRNMLQSIASNSPSHVHSSAVMHSTSERGHVAGIPATAELTPDLRGTEGRISSMDQGYETNMNAHEMFHSIQQSIAEEQKTSRPLQMNISSMPHGAVSSMGFMFPDLESLMRTQSFENGGMFGAMESIPSLYVSTCGPTAKVESLELPDQPDILLRDLSCGFESLRGKLGRDESLGLESMQSIDQSLDEVQKELDAEMAAEERRKSMH